MQPAGNHTAASGLCKQNHGEELTVNVAVSTAGAVCRDALVVVVVVITAVARIFAVVVAADAAVVGDLIT